MAHYTLRLPLWVDDLLAMIAENGEPTLATGARLRLWLVAARRGGRLKNEEKLLLKWARVTKKQWSEISGFILPSWEFDQKNNEFIIRRIVEALDKTADFSEKQRTKVSKRWNATVIPRQSHGNTTVIPSPSPSPSHDKERDPHLTQDLRYEGDHEKTVSEVRHTNHSQKTLSDVSDRPKRGGELKPLAEPAEKPPGQKEPSAYAKRLAAALCQEEPPPDEPELEPWEIEPPQDPQRAPPLDEDTPEGLWAYIHSELSQVSEKRVRRLIAQGLSRHEAYRAAATWRKKEGNGIENVGAYQYQLLESEFQAARRTQ